MIKRKLSALLKDIDSKLEIQKIDKRIDEQMKAKLEEALKSL